MRRLTTVIGTIAAVGVLVTPSTAHATSPTVPSVVLVGGPVVVRGNQWYERNTFTTGVADNNFVYGDPGDRMVIGDWNGDHVRTPGVVRGTTWYLRNSNTTGVADLTFTYGDPGDIAVVGDWDGNGTETIGVVRGTTWYLRNSNTSGVADIPAFTYGDGGDVPVAGDWNGDGIAGPGVVRPRLQCTGQPGAQSCDSIPFDWYLRNENTSGTADYAPPSLASHQPLAGHFTGTADDDIGGFRDGTWDYENSPALGPPPTFPSEFSYGDPGDTALTWFHPAG